MSYRTVIIGLGTIARYHVMAIAQSQRFRLCGVCDIREQNADDDLYRSYPFYQNYEELLTSVKPDAAVIATPPASHYAIANACLRMGVLPIVEKPLAATPDEGALFFAGDMKGRYVPVLHTLYGEEVLWLAEHPLHNITSIRMSLSDPYADSEGHVAERFVGLGGSWLDSAPNALAPLLRLVPSLSDIEVRHLRDTHTGLPYASTLTARHEQTTVSVELAWHRGINHKQTDIIADGCHFVLDHSAQTVTADGKELFAAHSERLTQQYANFYRMYPARVPTDEQLKYMYDIIYAHL